MGQDQRGPAPDRGWWSSEQQPTAGQQPPWSTGQPPGQPSAPGQPHQPWYGQQQPWSASPPRRRTLWPWFLLAGVLGVIALVGATVVSDPEFQESFRQGLAEGLGSRVGSLQVGTCFDGGTADEEGNFDDNVSPLECDEPHDSQLISTFSWEGSEPNSAYPGVDRMVDFAERRCLDDFRRTVGTDYNRSLLEMSYAYPSGQTWRFGDREFLCIVHGPGYAKLTERVDGSRR